MTYKEIDRDLLIRKRRIAFELGESNLPKYAKKFIERVLDSKDLTPTYSESEIRADERAKTIDEFIKRIEKNQTHHDSYTSPIEFDMSVDMTDILEIAEQMKGETENV